MKLAAFDKADKLIPFRVRQPDGIFILADRHGPQGLHRVKAVSRNRNMRRSSLEPGQ